MFIRHFINKTTLKFGNRYVPKTIMSTRIDSEAKMSGGSLRVNPDEVNNGQPTHKPADLNDGKDTKGTGDTQGTGDIKGTGTGNTNQQEVGRLS